METRNPVSRRAVTALLLVGLFLSWGCSQDTPVHYYPPPTPPIPEDERIGPLPVIPEEAIERIITGDARVGAETLLAVTFDERSALACVPLLLPRLEEPSDKLDETILYGETGQPVWWRLYNRGFHYPHKDRRSQILERLADCIREATPSRERADARMQFFAYLETDFLEAFEQNFGLACNAVCFRQDIKAQTGWPELFVMLDKLAFSGALPPEHVLRVARIYESYCLQNPEKEAEILSRYKDRLDPEFGEWLESAKRNDWARFIECDERTYRRLRQESLPELVESHAGSDASRVTVSLLAGTREVRAQSFPLVKPYFESIVPYEPSYRRWMPLFVAYCLPIPEEATPEERERQDWLIATLEEQVNKGVRGDWSIGSEPMKLLGHLIVPTNSDFDVQSMVMFRRPYRKWRILSVLLDQFGSEDPHKVEAAYDALGVLARFDRESAEAIRDHMLRLVKTDRKDWESGANPKRRLLELAEKSIEDFKSGNAR